MIHLRVKKWSGAFLERGVIEARFIKQVYDGEIANVSGAENDGILSIEVESRGQLCATGSASLPADAPSFSISEYVETAAVSHRKQVDATSYAPGKWRGTVPRARAPAAATAYLTAARQHHPTYAR